MRLSVRESDPGYGPDIHRATVLLDGVKTDYVVTADEEEGFILVYVDVTKDEEPTEKRGKVKIVIGHQFGEARDVCKICGATAQDMADGKADRCVYPFGGDA